MPSTTTYERGRVIVVAVPFSNHSGVKPRPALVVSSAAFHPSIRPWEDGPTQGER